MKKTRTISKTFRSLLSMILILSMLIATPVYVFAEDTTETSDTEAPLGIKGINVSLGEDIVVKFYTSAQSDDGSYLTVNFNGVEENLTVFEMSGDEGVFSYLGVTPQNLNDEISATMYNASNAQVGETKTFSVQSYLETLLSFNYGEEGCACGCASKLKHTALQELAVNMLNYGSMAQNYVSHDVENLANKNLTDAQKELATETITVSDTDKAVNGSAWVGAGIRFDYKLGLYFVFEATSADEYTATINGETVTPESYTAAGENCYVIRYNKFNATNMNSVVTAKLSKDGAEDQTFAYSVKSYVAAKGGSNSTLADLVNATYVYGFAAVAYSAEYAEVAPTFEAAGSLTMDGKGYDFTESQYGSLVLPQLNSMDYTAITVNNGTVTAPSVVTEFVLNHDLWAYSRKFDATDCINVNGTLASKYDYAKLNNSQVAVAYDETTGYTVIATDATLTALVTYGAELTIKGSLTMDLTTPEGGTAPTWTLYKKTTLGDGTEAGKAIVTVANAAGNGVVLGNANADMLVTKGSSLTDNKISVGSATLTIDGTVTATASVSGSAYEYVKDVSYETGIQPSIYICNGGVLNTGHIVANFMQIGSLVEDTDEDGGVLNITGTSVGENNTLITRADHGKTSRHFYLKGTINAESKTANSRLLNAKVGSSPKPSGDKSEVDIRSGMTINLGTNMQGLMYFYQNNEAHKYNVFWQVGADVDTTNIIYLYSQNVYFYVWQEAEVLLGADATETTKVLVANRVYFASNTTWMKASALVAPDVTVDTVLTAGTETVSTSVLGTLTQATYTDSEGTAHTVYYRVLG